VVTILVMTETFISQTLLATQMEHLSTWET